MTGGFKFDLTGFTVSQVIDHSHQTLPVPLHPAASSFEAHVLLPAKGVVPIPFGVNLTGVNAGEACIFHLIQTSMNDVAEGGLTLVVLKL